MKKLRYVAWFILLAALAVSVLTTFILLQQRDSLKQDLKNAITTELHSELQNIPIPKDGTNGQDATPQQIQQAVASYLAQNPIKNGYNGTNGLNATNQQVQQAVDTYMADHPVKDGKDGQNGTDGLTGKTPQIRCNVTKNRWEVRYSDIENWQSLNGQTVKCTLSTE